MRATAIAAFCVVASAAFAADDQPITIFGTTIGQPLTRGGSPAAPPPGLAPIPGVTEFSVAIRPDERPGFIKYSQYFVRVMDGNVEGMTIFTSGLETQEIAIIQLQEKFGKPSHLEKMAKVNGAGVRVEYYDAVWIVGPTEIHFEGITDDARTGIIRVSSIKLDKAMLSAEPHSSGPHL